MTNTPLILMDPHPRNEMMVFPPDTEAALRGMGELVTHFGSRAPDDLVEACLPRAWIIIGQTAMPRERLDRAPNLRAILNVKANWEPNIDYAESHARGIHVLSAAPAMAPAVAEFALGQAIALLRGMGELVTHFGSRAPDELVEACLPRAWIIIGQTAMPRERLDQAPNLRAILNVKANWEPNIDYAEAHARGIHVLSAAPAMAPAVAEFALGQAIALLRGIHTADARFRSGTEAYGIAGNGAARSLYGAEVALVGYGNLGRALAPLLRPFGVTLKAHDPWLSDGYLRAEGLIPVSLETALAEADVIFLLAGVTSQNEGGLTRDRLRTVRQDASVILASRAEIVDFDGFLALAAEGHFRAAVDVYPEEPVPAGAAWRDTPHVLFSAHLAGGIRDSYARIREMMLDDIGQILKGLPPLRMQRAEPRLASLMRSR